MGLFWIRSLKEEKGKWALVTQNTKPNKKDPNKRKTIKHKLKIKYNKGKKNRNKNGPEA